MGCIQGKRERGIPDLTGLVAVVTGGSRGIGRQVVAKLLAGGAHVVVGVRNTDKAARLLTDLLDVHGDRLQLMTLDVSSLASVERFARAYVARGTALHLLICNAGVMCMAHADTPEGINVNVATNHLGHFHLVNCLAPVLAASAPSRVVMVSSSTHAMAGRLDRSYLASREPADGWSSYTQTKLANVMHAYELDRRLAGSGISVAVVHPGNIISDITTQWFGFLTPVIMFVAWVVAFVLWAIGLGRIMSPTFTGGDGTVFAAVHPDVAGLSGVYVADFKVALSSPESYDRDDQRWLWDTSAALVERVRRDHGLAAM